MQLLSRLQSEKLPLPAEILAADKAPGLPRGKEDPPSPSPKTQGTHDTHTRAHTHNKRAVAVSRFFA